MNRACIAIVDAAHTRLYTYEPQGDLQEVRDLVSAGRQAHKIFSDTKPGNRWQEGGRGSTDDHRDNHLAMRDEKFAKLVIDEIARVAADDGLHHLILVASPKMLGMLRTDLDRLRAKQITIDEVTQDLGWMTSAQLHDHLAAMNLIAPRARVARQG